MEETLKLSKSNSLVNLSNSILYKYGIKPFHQTIPYIDELLKNEDKKISLVLLDGFGKYIIEHFKDYCPFIYSSLKYEIDSVFPSTTTASTTSLLSSKYPIETGYIGWSEYFNKYDSYIDIFLSKNSLTKEDIYPNVLNLLKYESIIDLINKTKKYKARSFLSLDYKNNFKEDDLDVLFNEANNLIDYYDFSYIYVSEPDHLLHHYGLNDKYVYDIVKYLDENIKNLAKVHPNTLFLVIADHGLTDVKLEYIGHHQEFIDSLEDKNFFLEGRFATFKVKNKKRFIDSYNKFYKNDFILKTKEDILNEKILGYSDTINKYAYETLGDFFLISKSDMCFINTLSSDLKMHHSGIKKEETKISMGVINL